MGKSIHQLAYETYYGRFGCNCKHCFKLLGDLKYTSRHEPFDPIAHHQLANIALGYRSSEAGQKSCRELEKHRRAIQAASPI
jgi:hypothetical protein